MQESSSEFLSPEKLQLFVAGLSGLPPEEVRKAKVLYIRNAISEYLAMRASSEAFGEAQGCLAVLFRAHTEAQRKLIAAQLRVAKVSIRDAVDGCRDDLK